MIIYFIQVNIVVTVLFPVYFLLLKREKFFLLNRYFFFCMLVMAVLLPVFPRIDNSHVKQINERVARWAPLSGIYQTGDAVGTPAVKPVPRPVRRFAPAPHPVVTVTQVCVALYLFVVALLLGVLIRRVVQLGRLIRQSTRAWSGGICYCRHDRAIPPFSFFRFLVINESQYAPEQLRQVIAHEEVHIRDGHTRDILLAEFLHIVLWINPVVILWKRCVKLNLEYIADDNVLGSGINRKAYQMNILRTSLKASGYPLASLFNSSKLKLRIKMMNTQKSSVRNLYKYAFILPLLLGAYFVVNALSVTPRKTLLVSAQDLKAFEGFYKLSGERRQDAYVQIIAREGNLVLKQIWDGKEIPLRQTADLEFNDADGDFPLQFTRDASGTITQLLAFKRDLWIRDPNYKPITRQFIELPSEQLSAFGGTYELVRDDKNADVFVQIFPSDTNIVLKQLWDNHSFGFNPLSPLSFGIASRPGFTLDFTRDGDGRIGSFVAFGKDVWVRKDGSAGAISGSVELTPDQLKAFAGKYRIEGNKEVYAECRVDNQVLLIHQEGTEITRRYLAVSDTKFACKAPDGTVFITFEKDKNGAVIKGVTSGDGIWDKVQ